MYRFTTGFIIETDMDADAVRQLGASRGVVRGSGHNGKRRQKIQALCAQRIHLHRGQPVSVITLPSVLQVGGSARPRRPAVVAVRKKRKVAVLAYYGEGGQSRTTAQLRRSARLAAANADVEGGVLTIGNVVLQHRGNKVCCDQIPDPLPVVELGLVLPDRIGVQSNLGPAVLSDTLRVNRDARQRLVAQMDSLEQMKGYVKVQCLEMKLGILPSVIGVEDVLTMRHMAMLSGTIKAGWVNDEIVNMAGPMIRGLAGKTEQEVLITSSYVFKEGVRPKTGCVPPAETNAGTVRRLRDKLDGLVVAPRLILVPINRWNSHWLLSAVLIAQKKILIFDSWRKKYYLSNQQLQEYGEKIKEILLESFPSSLTDDRVEWTVDRGQHINPQGVNGNCGLYVLSAMGQLIAEWEMHSKTDEEVTQYRLELAISMLRESKEI